MWEGALIALLSAVVGSGLGLLASFKAIRYQLRLDAERRDEENAKRREVETRNLRECLTSNVRVNMLRRVGLEQAMDLCKARNLTRLSLLPYVRIPELSDSTKAHLGSELGFVLHRVGFILSRAELFFEQMIPEARAAAGADSSQEAPVGYYEILENMLENQITMVRTADDQLEAGLELLRVSKADIQRIRERANEEAKQGW